MHGNTFRPRRTARWPRVEWLWSGSRKGGALVVRRVWLPSPRALRRPLSLPNLQMNLAEQHVPGSKNTYYIPDFVTTDEETYLLRKVSPGKLWTNHPTPSRILMDPLYCTHQILETPQPKWKQLSNRRYVLYCETVVFRAQKMQQAADMWCVTPLADIISPSSRLCGRTRRW